MIFFQRLLYTSEILIGKMNLSDYVFCIKKLFFFVKKARFSFNRKVKEKQALAKNFTLRGLVACTVANCNTRSPVGTNITNRDTATKGCRSRSQRYSPTSTRCLFLRSIRANIAQCNLDFFVSGVGGYTFYDTSCRTS